MTARGRPTRVMHRGLSCFATFRYPCRARGPAGCGRSRSHLGGAHGVRLGALRSVAPARRALDRRPILLTHLPFPERRPDGFFGGSAVPRMQISSESPTVGATADRGRLAAAPGFACSGGQSVPDGFLNTSPAVTALGFGSSLRCSAHRGVRPRSCPSGLEVPASDRWPPEIRSRGSYPLVGLVCLTCVRSEMLLDPDKP